MSKQNKENKTAVQTKPHSDPIPAVPKFNFYLVVINPFGGYEKGQQITDDVAIQAVIDSGRLRNCAKSTY